MNPERKELSKSQAIHRRRELAAQKKQLPTGSVIEPVNVVDSKRRRLREISEKLKSDTLRVEERTILTFQEIWLKHDVNETSQATRRDQLQKFDRDWKERFPETHKWFFEETLPDGRTHAFNARQEVVPDQPKPFRQIRP